MSWRRSSYNPEMVDPKPEQPRTERVARRLSGRDPLEATAEYAKAPDPCDELVLFVRALARDLARVGALAGPAAPGVGRYYDDHPGSSESDRATHPDPQEH